MKYAFIMRTKKETTKDPVIYTITENDDYITIKITISNDIGTDVSAFAQLTNYFYITTPNYLLPGEEFSIQVPISNVKAGHIYTIELCTGAVGKGMISNSSGCSLKMTPLYEFIDRYTFTGNKRASFNIAKVFYAQETDTIYIYTPYAHTSYTEEQEVIQTESGYMAIENLLQSLSVNLKTKIEKAKIKAKSLLNGVDYYNTLAYLEVQVDTLTRIVNQMISENIVNPSDNLKALISAANANSVLDVKNQEKLLSEINDNKVSFRLNQTTYYTTRDSNLVVTKWKLSDTAISLGWSVTQTGIENDKNSITWEELKTEWNNHLDLFSRDETTTATIKRTNDYDGNITEVIYIPQITYWKRLASAIEDGWVITDNGIERNVTGEEAVSYTWDYIKSDWNNMSSLFFEETTIDNVEVYKYNILNTIIYLKNTPME